MIENEILVVDDKWFQWIAGKVKPEQKKRLREEKKYLQ